ncbi:MAG: ABC transporter ATP-binding protein, partial [Lentisphaeria bacterium]|nr:ABC transporter ATP-binding protein [Lentisphaeria bacterium]
MVPDTANSAATARNAAPHPTPRKHPEPAHPCTTPPRSTPPGPPTTDNGFLLHVQGLERHFGGVVALHNVSFAVRPGQIKTVIGPNGAGKTTLFNVISGLLPAARGRVLYEGRNILGLKPFQIAQRGISRTFQNLSLFGNMSVGENVMVGRHCRTSRGILSAILRSPSQRREEREVRSDAMAILEVVGLAEKREEPVSALSFGQRRLVELARALATQPRLLLLDEPASGLNTKETEDLGGVIRGIRDQGITVLLVEHDMSLVMDISDSILVLNYGEPIAEGDPATIRNDPQVVAIYLG